MYFIWCGVVGGDLGGQGALPADNTPVQRKAPLTPPPPKTPPFLIWLWWVFFLSRISDFREPPTVLSTSNFFSDCSETYPVLVTHGTYGEACRAV